MIHNLPDVQACEDGFPRIPIQKVGVRGVRAPFMFGNQRVLGNFSMYCDLSESLKGINMSRMARTLADSLRQDSEIMTLRRIVMDLQEAHKTDNIYAKCAFDLPYSGKTPITDLEAFEHVPVILESKLSHGRVRNYLSIKYTGMSLCPCSREMSLLSNNLTFEEKVTLESLALPASLREKLAEAGFGAHNQKSHIEIKVELTPQLPPSDAVSYLLTVAGNAASSHTVSVLKRPDEKYITEVSYGGFYIDDQHNLNRVQGAGAKFVEDIARQVAEVLSRDEDFADYAIVVNNEESIHSSDIQATAILTAGKDLR